MLSVVLLNHIFAYFKFTPLEYYRYWSEIERLFHEEDHERLRQRSVLQRSLISAYEKLHAQRLAQFEKQETEVIECFFIFNYIIFE